jgi:diguanylate cyclase (GGDEF)-like protein
VSDRWSNETWADLQSNVFELLAYGEPAKVVATVVCRYAEEFAPETICSVLSVDRDGRLHPLASPSLPDAYSNALDGLPIGPTVGSCGTAAYLGEPVIVSDIENDPLWQDYKQLPLPLGLKACWSTPIKARDGRVIGTFAFYFRAVRGPSDRERQIVDRCTHLCALVIEHEEIGRRVHDLAYLDTFTDLPNRTSFDRRLLEATRPGEPGFALLLCDADHLKEVNDAFGHAGGDAVILTVAARLKTLGRKFEAFRLGGDEFAVLVNDCDSEDGMAAAYQTLIAAVRQPFQHHGQTLSPSLTTGGVRHRVDGTDPDTLCQNAGFALDHGKERNRGGFVRFRPDLRNAITNRIQIIRDVAEALAEDRLLPYYQPIVRLDTAEIIGVEALARMRSVDGGIVSAGQFQEAMTDPRIASGLTASMLEKVAANVRSWLDEGIPFQHVGLNVAGADFQRGDLEPMMTEAFERAGVPLKHVILEVTETVFMGGRDNVVPHAIGSLRKKGVLVALDDFGTGFASLTHLLSFPVDIIKIDKSFVDGIVDDHQSVVIVEALIDLGRRLGMRIVTEGIETAEQAAKLLSLGCTLGQGYHFGRPAPASTTATLLQRFAQRPKRRPVKHAVPYRVSA